MIGAQGTVNLAIKRKNTPTCDVSLREPKTEICFSIETRSLAKFVNGLNTSLALAAGKL